MTQLQEILQDLKAVEERIAFSESQKGYDTNLSNYQALRKGLFSRLEDYMRSMKASKFRVDIAKLQYNFVTLKEWKVYEDIFQIDFFDSRTLYVKA